MKKRVLMIGDTSDLQGVSVDICSYYDFFTSPVGGNWCNDEIEILESPTKRQLFKRIDEIDNADYDYVITIFSGHGMEVDDDIVLTINGEGEDIVLDDLTNLSEKQLLIIDCCRVSYALQPVDLTSITSETTAFSMSRDPIRKAYEECIEKAMPQEVILFACNEGETSTDTVDENTRSYSQHLLDATQEALAGTRSPFISVNRAHSWAAALMRENPFVRQRPQIQCSCRPRHLRLPWAVNVEFL